MSLWEWSVRNRVAVNLMCFFLLVTGWMTASTRLKLDLFPDVSTNFIQISTLDPSTSSAEEIERTVTVPLEEELAAVRGIKRIQSNSEDNFSNIFVEVDPSVTNLDPVINEVRQAVDKARSKLPSTIESPVIEEFDIPIPLITFTVSMPAQQDPMEIRPLFENLRRKLRIIPGVSNVLVDGLDRREIWVEVDFFKMQKAGLSFQEITDAVARKNINAVAGRLDGMGGQRLVRLTGEILSPEELANIPVKTSEGRVLLLRDLASFRSTSEEPRTIGRTDLRPSVTFTIVKKRGADALQTVRDARRVFEQGTALLPEGVEARTVMDSTRFIRVRINTVVQNGIQALLLVSVLLVLLLNWRLALLVAFGIPISFAGALIVLYLGGYTINLLSLFAMIMALGMVVDDAIVMAENCFRYLQAGLPPARAALVGSKEVFWPVVGSVSTTVAAFLPLIWGEGIIGKFLMIVPVVVISALIFSLAQAFIVLPSHIADFVRRGRTAADLAAMPSPRGFARLSRFVAVVYRDMRDVVDVVLKGTIEIYLHLLKKSIRCRYFVIFIFLAMLCSGVAIVAGGLVPFKLFATDFADNIYIKAELPADYSLQQTTDAVARVERRIVEILPPEDVMTIITRVGARFDPSNKFLEYGTNLALINIDIDEENPSCRKPSEIARSLRRILSEFPEFVELSVLIEESGPPVGRSVNVELGGENFEDLQQAAREMQTLLADIPGVYNIGNDFPRGKTELRVLVNEERAALAGVDSLLVTRELQGAFFGLEAARMRWGNEEVVLRVKGAERLAQDPDLLERFRVRTRDGKNADLSIFADVQTATGVSRVKRANQQRVVTVSADVEKGTTTSAAVNAQIRRWLPELTHKYPNVSVNLTGENEDTERSLSSMLFAASVALLLIYGLLSVIANSFFQPFVIMATIPYGVTGVILGLLIMGQPIGLMAIMGTVALSGIVVNNAVVFVDFINQNRRKVREIKRDTAEEPEHVTSLNPMTRWRSIMQSAATRFRPVFLTTATTVVGLSNLAFASSGQEQFLAPMAQAIIFGLIFATANTLLLIPCLYSILDDLLLFSRHPRKSRSATLQLSPRETSG